LRLQTRRDNERGDKDADPFQSKTLSVVIQEMLQKAERLSQGRHPSQVRFLKSMSFGASLLSRQYAKYK
jgi:hypothetical protein